jgi:hypothetical protein
MDGPPAVGTWERRFHRLVCRVATVSKVRWMWKRTSTASIRPVRKSTEMFNQESIPKSRTLGRESRGERKWGRHHYRWEGRQKWWMVEGRVLCCRPVSKSCRLRRSLYRRPAPPALASVSCRGYGVGGIDSTTSDLEVKSRAGVTGIRRVDRVINQMGLNRTQV